MINKIIIKDSFEMPAVDDTVSVLISESHNLVPNCWLWNESVGYLKVAKFSLYDNRCDLENIGRRENAKAGTVFPSCMEFLVTAPTAVDLTTNMVTCLRADFKSPTVGQEALMSVESTYAMKADDQIIVDRDYRYLIVQVINSTTIKVLNEGLGKEGIIEAGCTECVPIQILNNIQCCPIPSGDLTSTSPLITVTDGANNVLDNISLDLDTDLSKYDNSTSEFLATTDKKNLTSNTSVLSVTNGTGATLENTTLTLDTDLSKYDNSTSGFLAPTDKKNLTSTTPILTITNGTGTTLENTSLTINTDLSQYDNSVSQFVSVSGIPSNDLVSTTSVLTISGGTGATLENTTLTLDTDLSKYDNSTSGFITVNDIPALPLDTDLSKYDNTTSEFITVNDVPRGTLSSATAELSVVGGTNNVLSNISLTLDKDLSKYDNSTSKYITVGDIPALPADTDLSHYDNTTSGFITSASIPAVNDASLTIYESDGVTPFVTFSANASTAVTATLPTSGSAYTASSPISIDSSDNISISQANSTTNGYLSSTDWTTFNNKSDGLLYFEESLSGTTATWASKSGSATTFNLGSTTNKWNNGDINNINTHAINNSYNNIDYIQFPNSSNIGHTVIYNAGTGTTNYGTHAFACGAGNKLVIEGNQTVSYSSFYPNPHSSDINTGRSLGSNSSSWREIHVRNVYTNSINMGVGNANSLNLKAAVQIVVSTMNNTGTINFIRDSNVTGNLGISDRHWNNAYITNVYANTVDPNTNNTGHVGQNSRYYAQMHCATLTQHSDRKDKENIIERNATKGRNITSLNKLNSLKTYTFNFKEGNNIRTHLGVMADEVYEIEPLCASLLEDDTPGSKTIEGTPTGIDIGAMIALLLEGIKELSDEVKELKSKLGDKDADSKVLEK